MIPTQSKKMKRMTCGFFRDDLRGELNKAANAACFFHNSNAVLYFQYIYYQKQSKKQHLSHQSISLYPLTNYLHSLQLLCKIYTHSNSKTSFIRFNMQPKQLFMLTSTQHTPDLMFTFMLVPSIPKYKSKSLMAFIMALTILFLNIRSLQTHKLLFEQLLLEEQINAFLLNETHLKPTTSIRIPRYTMLRQDSQIPAQRANGGTAIGFSPSIAYRQYNPQLQNLPEHLIATLYYKNIYITLVTIYIRQVIPYQTISLRTYPIISETLSSWPT